MGYGEKELAVARPIAEALECNPDFRRWFIEQTQFAPSARTARLLSEEMRAQRSKRASTWWRSHFSGSCRCLGCQGGQETDLLAIFECSHSDRFAVHVEVKHAGDSFTNDAQAVAYPIRAACWTHNPPRNVLQHRNATTMLLCSSIRLKDYAAHVKPFNSVMTFEDIEKAFPGLTGQF